MTPRLAKHYDVAISSMYGLEGSSLTWQGIRVLPGVGQDFGNACLLQHAKEHFGEITKGIVLTLIDVWPLNTQMVSKLNVACWVPVDHEPVIPQVTRFFKESGAVPIAMSRFGERQLKSVDLDPLYAPHAVDTSIFKPHDRAEIREQTGIPKDAFLVGMVAANKGRPSRKGFAQAFQAFAMFKERHNEAILYLHTVADPAIASGEDLWALARATGIQDSVQVAPPYRMMFDPYPPQTMAQLYSSLDILLNPAQGEGFGIPVLEAAACGVPSVVTNWTAMPEVAGVGGWAVGCRPYWTPGNAWMANADVEEIVGAMEICYSQSDEERKERTQALRNHALAYDVEKVVGQYFLPALQAVEERVGEKTPSVSKTELPQAA